MGVVGLQQWRRWQRTEVPRRSFLALREMTARDDTRYGVCPNELTHYQNEARFDTRSAAP
jgi:hypothetical protein